MWTPHQDDQGAQHCTRPLSQHALEWVPLEQIAKFKILLKHIKALVPAKPLQLGRMDTAIHARGERAALQAVAAEIAPTKARCHGACLNDLDDSLRAYGLRADPGQRRGLARRRRPQTDLPP